LVEGLKDKLTGIHVGLGQLNHCKVFADPLLNVFVPEVLVLVQERQHLTLQSRSGPHHLHVGCQNESSRLLTHVVEVFMDQLKLLLN
jgi:hypothetical protein